MSSLSSWATERPALTAWRRCTTALNRPDSRTLPRMIISRTAGTTPTKNTVGQDPGPPWTRSGGRCPRSSKSSHSHQTSGQLACKLGFSRLNSQMRLRPEANSGRGSLGCPLPATACAGSSGSGSTRRIPRAPVASPTAERPAHIRTPPAASTIVSAARICRRARDCSRIPSAIATTARPIANPSHRPTAPMPNGKASSQPPTKPIAQ